MRLLRLDDRGELRLTEDLPHPSSKYAILSHTWGEDSQELKFKDVRDGNGKSKAGYAKVRSCAEQAKKDGLKYCWVDTCCIDQDNPEEVREAIISMFHWYSRAERCYVYLCDVSALKRGSDGMMHIIWQQAFSSSRWFTRGWTLQELLAPASVDFFSRDWLFLGSTKTHGALIERITKIPLSAIHGAPLSEFTFKQRMQWAANRRKKKKEDKIYCLQGIFGVFIPPLYGEGDYALTRLKDEIWKRYRDQLDEIGPDFFKSSLGPFDSVQDDTPSMNAQEISHDKLREEIMDSLNFEQIDSRRITIKVALSNTCEWLLEHPAFLSWADPNKMQDHHGVLWIKGKPGAGKSTLVKFAHGHAERQKQEGELVISFFFNARGDELEKNIVGMYRALLFQLLKEAADVQQVLDDVHHPIDPDQWTVKTLQETFKLAISRLGQRRLKCFIDALDECDENEIRDMVHFFDQLGCEAVKNGDQLYVCFASRHYPAIDIPNGCQLTVEHERGHSDDLAEYVKSHLRAGKGKGIEEIRNQIQDKANRVFMWIVIVVHILNEEFRRGRIFAVKKRLHETPPELGNLFKDILRRDCANMEDLLLCLQCILFAKRPLRREEFYYAMVSGLDPSVDSLTAWDPEYITVGHMNSFVLNSSKGLAELSKSSTPTVQFIHESVRDFLLKDDGLREIWPDIGRDLESLSHDRLKRCCQHYLNVDLADYDWCDERLPKASSDSAKTIRKNLDVKFPFLEYACNNVLYHADEAARDLPQDEFLELFPLKTWIAAANLFEQDDILRHTPNASLLYVFAENNFARLLRRVSCRSMATIIPGELHQYPIFAAIANGHRDSVRALLKDHEISLVWKDLNPLHWAIYNGHEAFAQVLITSTDVNLHERALGGRSALSVAALKGFEGVCNLLLASDAVDFTLLDKHGRSPLSYAAEAGRTTIVKTLIDKGVRIETADNFGSTPLMIAAQHGRHASVELLLKHGANVEAADLQKNTALLLAVQTGSHALVQLLIDHGAKLNAANQEGNTALLVAAQNGEEVLAQLLLDKGANEEVANTSGATALLLAAKTGMCVVMQRLLVGGANIEATTTDLRTPLSYAIENGHKEAVQLLLERGANIATEIITGRPAIVWAVQKNSASRDLGRRHLLRIEDMLTLFSTTTHRLSDYQGELTVLEKQDNRGQSMEAQATSHKQRPDVPENRRAIIKLLIEADADVNATDGVGKSPLSIAAEYHHDSIVQLLLDQSANVESVDPRNRTALLLAAEHGHFSTLQLLLSNGANIEAVDDDGKTVLLWAAKRSDRAMVQVLLDRAANVEAAAGDGNTALIYAAQAGCKTIVRDLLARARRGCEAIVEELLVQGANIEATDYDGYTALLCVAHAGCKPMVQGLLSRGANSEAANVHGETILSFAARKGWMTIVRNLLGKGINMERDGPKALSWAIEYGHEEVAQLLRERSATKEASNLECNS